MKTAIYRKSKRPEQPQVLRGRHTTYIRPSEYIPGNDRIEYSDLYETDVSAHRNVRLGVYCTVNRHEAQEIGITEYAELIAGNVANQVRAKIMETFRP